MDDLEYGAYDTSYSPKLLISNIEDLFQFEELLGTGSFGQVFRAVGKITGRNYAVKILSTPTPLNLETEIGVIKEISKYPNCSPDLLCYIDTFSFIDKTDGNKIYYVAVYEYINGINLKQSLEKEGLWDPERVTIFLIWLMGVVQDLHDKNITHRDIKPQNIMQITSFPFGAEKTDFNVLSDGRAYKLIDFGLGCFTHESPLVRSRSVSNNLICGNELAGTMGYIPPEVYNLILEKNPRLIDEKWEKADTFAIGVTAYYLLTGDVPYKADANGILRGPYIPPQVQVFVNNNLETASLARVDPYLNDIIRSLLNLNPLERASLDDALKRIILYYGEDEISQTNPNDNFRTNSNLSNSAIAQFLIENDININDFDEALRLAGENPNQNIIQQLIENRTNAYENALRLALEGDSL